MIDDESVRVGASSLSMERLSGGASGSPVQNRVKKSPMLLRKNMNEDDEPWAEVAKFNQLLDLKIKLDEASEMKRKANM